MPLLRDFTIIDYVDVLTKWKQVLYLHGELSRVRSLRKQEKMLTNLYALKV